MKVYSNSFLSSSERVSWDASTLERTGDFTCFCAVPHEVVSIETTAKYLEDYKAKESKANALGVDNIGGVFVVLLCGLAFAVLISIIEFCIRSKQDNFTDPLNILKNRQSLCAEMTEEFCFALSCRGTRQKPALKRQCSKCANANTVQKFNESVSFDITN